LNTDLETGGEPWPAISPPLDASDSQFGIILAGREEGAEPGNAANFKFERYTGKIAWYKNFNERFRAGIGYAAERVNGTDDGTESGPYVHLSFNTLDDPILPTKGTSFASEIWLPTGKTAVTHTAFQTHLPIWQKWKFVFGGGLKTGDSDSMAYASASWQQRGTVQPCAASSYWRSGILAASGGSPHDAEVVVGRSQR